MSPKEVWRLYRFAWLMCKFMKWFKQRYSDSPDYLNDADWMEVDFKELEQKYYDRHFGKKDKNKQ